jgi:hypothetical protein
LKTFRVITRNGDSSQITLIPRRIRTAAVA